MDHLYVRSFRCSVSVLDEDVSETDKIPLIHVPGSSYSSAVYIAFRKYLPSPVPLTQAHDRTDNRRMYLLINSREDKNII